jgi:MFS family permease
MLTGCLVLLAGLAVTFAAIATTTAAAFLAGTAVAGVGTGLALLGVNRTLIALAPPGQRAGLIAAIFIISFLGLSIPALIAGVATAHAGLHRTALAYCLAMAALVAVAAGSLMLRRRGPATGQGASCDDHKQRRDAGPLSDRVQRGAEGHGHEELSQYRRS